ncbi:MAG TPA: amino acid permease [Myxococcota bacterium]|nr:amino acid permease [Myxococcota bacterium]
MASSWLRRKSIREALLDDEGGLRKDLGAVDLTLLGIGAIIGAGLFSSIADMVTGTDATLGAGPAVIVSYLLTAIACGFAALCYAEIAAMVPISGSAYTYSYVAFGEVVAWIIGWDLIIEYAIGNIYVAARWGSYLQTLLEGLFGWRVPAWLATDIQTARALVAADPSRAGEFPTLFGAPFSVDAIAGGAVLGITVLLWLGVRESARANAAMVVLKLALIALFLGIGVFHVDPANWSPFAPNGAHGIWQGAALGFFSYIGFDAVSTAAEETRDPQRDMPRGMIASLLICTVLYMAVAAVLTGILPMSELDTVDDPLAAVFGRIGMHGVETAMAFGAVVAMSAVLLVFQLGQTRIFMVMARDGLLPEVFSRLHPTYRTPAVSTWVTGVGVMIGCSVLTPDQAIGLCNIGTLFAFVLVSLGVIVLRVREPDIERPFKVPGYPVTPVLAALSCLALIVGLERSNWLRFVGWLAIGLVVYVAFGRRFSRLAREA